MKMGINMDNQCRNCINYRRKTKHKGICERMERVSALIDIVDIYVLKDSVCQYFKRKMK